MKRTRTKKTPLKFFTFTVLGNFLLNFQHYIEKNILKIEFHTKFGAMAYWLRHWISHPGVPSSKLMDDSKVNLTFHPSKFDQISTRNF